MYCVWRSFIITVCSLVYLSFITRETWLDLSCVLSKAEANLKFLITQKTKPITFLVFIYIVREIQLKEISYDQTINTHIDRGQRRLTSPAKQPEKSAIITQHFRYCRLLGSYMILHLQVQGLHLQSDPHLQASFSATKVSPEASY